jgi:hypothetical protein
MTAFVSCRNCGRYINTGTTALRGYCSKECIRQYSACVSCGRYFHKGEGFDAEHCSRECTAQYVIRRKYGPQPVTIVAEV